MPQTVQQAKASVPVTAGSRYVSRLQHDKVA